MVPSPALLRQFSITVALRAAGLALVVVVWLVAAANLGVARLPGPGPVFEALRDNFSDAPYLHLQAIPGGYWSNALYTVRNALEAFLIGGLIGFVLGLASARLQVMRNVVSPLLILFGAIPPLVMAPFMLIWFGVGPGSQRPLVVLGVFVIVGIGAQNAALTLAPRYEESAATLGVSPPRRVFTILVPASIPAVLGAARVALATAWSLQVAAELFGSKLGVGRVILASQGIAYSAGTIAVILLLAAIGALLDLVLVCGARYLGRWQATVST
ncbi:MAG: ABC transporter permease subunit [Solirubrobacterales bacterium]